jgi:glycosyltransferase involved in cell wall biosynthesis
MNILWQTEHYPDARKGGGSVTNTRHITQELRRLGQGAAILARGDSGEAAGRDGVDASPVVRLTPPVPPRRLWPVWPFLEPRALLKSLGRLSAPFETFVCHDASYGLAFKHLHPTRPVVFRIAGAARIHHACVPRPQPESGGALGARNRLLKRLVAFQEDQLDRRAWHRADALVVQSAFMKQDVSRLYGIAPERIRVIPSGVDHERLGRLEPTATMLAALGDPGRENRVIAFCGRLVRMKNVSYLLRAFAAMRLRHRCLLVIAGDGEERARLQTEAFRLGVGSQVKFLGHVEATEELLAVADIFVLPSTYEPFSNALLEAMAAGLPCLALKPDARTVRTSGAEIIVEGETGFLVDAGDPRHLADRLDLLLADPSRRAHMGAHARARCRSAYSWSACAQHYLQTLQELVDAVTLRPGSAA